MGLWRNLKAQRESVGGTGPGESCWLLFVSVGSSRGVLFWMGLLQFELQRIRILPQRGHDILFHQHMDNERRGFFFRGMNSSTLLLLKYFLTVVVVKSGLILFRSNLINVQTYHLNVKILHQCIKIIYAKQVLKSSYISTQVYK